MAEKIVGKKENKAFMILSALGILFVVDVHLGQPLSVLNNVFPYDSFFMPMFAFISGYFFQERSCDTWKNLCSFCARKLRKLLLPYLGWMIFYNCLNELLCKIGLWQIHGTSVWEMIYGIITSGVVFAFNSPAWFAPTLFCVCSAYGFLRCLIGKRWQEDVAMLLFIVMGTAAVWLAGTDFNVPLHYMLLKTAFFLQFYHMGFWFRKRLEAWFDGLSAGTVCLCAAVCNLLLLAKYGKTIEFPICSVMGGFQSGNLLLPLITSLTGIAFWLKVAKALVPLLGQRGLVNFVSDHTFWIMTHHIGVKHLFIGLCALGAELGCSWFGGIDMAQFLSDGLYLYSAHPWCASGALLFTMVVLILGGKLWDWIKELLLKRFRNMRTV